MGRGVTQTVIYVNTNLANYDHKNYKKDGT